MSKPDLPPGMTKRGGVYWADFRHGGRRFRKSLSRSLKVARELLTQLRARAERGEYGLIDNRFRLEKLAALYLAEVKQTRRPRTHTLYKGSLNRILPHLPPDVAQLQPEHVIRYRQDRLLQVEASSVNVEVVALKIMLNWAVDTGRIGSNPLAKVKQLRHEAGGARALKPEEVHVLLSHSPDGWRDVWYAYASTELRRMELSCLTAREIDWDAREIVVTAQRAKSRRERRVPLDDALYVLLKELAVDRAPDEPVLLSPRGIPIDRSSPCRMLRKHCRAAGVDPHRVTLHSLRKAFATGLFIAGVDPKTVQDLLGHATLEMTMKIYTEVFPTTRRQAIGRLPWGAGASDPEHLVTFPDGHKMPTVPRAVAASG